MKIVKPSVELIWITPDAEQVIEKAGRVCYKSENKITNQSSTIFIKNIIKKGHESVLEHACACIKFVCDRGVTHELVRHRLASFSQESTRYVSSTINDNLIIKDDNDIIDLYLSGLSMKKIAQISTNNTEWEIYKILLQNNIKRRKHGRRGTIDENYFKQIDTPEKAYTLGLIASDGSIRKDKKGFNIDQKINNKWYIKRTLKLIQPDLQDTSIYSKEIVNDLNNLGIVSRKSFEWKKEDVLKLWNSIPNNYKHSFIRGVLDGDGCVRFFIQPKASKFSCNISFCGSIYLMELMQDYINEYYGYKTKLYRENNSFGKFGITKYKIAKLFCTNLMKDFKFPYGNPYKVERILEHIEHDFPIVEYGDKHFQVILPFFFYKKASLWKWAESMDKSEESYKKLRFLGATPQEARSVLPNSLKTEIIVTANFRELRLIFNLRCNKSSHPQMRQIILRALKILYEKSPTVFGDIYEKFTENK